MWNDYAHIYVEERIADEPLARNVLTKFGSARPIVITHYKDIFNRPRQEMVLQQGAKKLILAKKEGNFLYKGPSIIQAFGSENLHYSAMVLGCPYTCDYCYLQGMYQSGNIVVFVNIDDALKETKELLKKGPLYVCLSYDTDLLAYEKIFGFVGRWIELAYEEPNLTIEIRTKSANFGSIAHYPPSERVIFAVSLAPQSLIDTFEENTASLKGRVKGLKLAQEKGWNVRLCFEPLLYVPHWEASYRQLIDDVFAVLEPQGVRDCNGDIFRISPTYLKRMQKSLTPSSVLWYPYEVRDGLATYRQEEEMQLKQKLKEMLLVYLPEEKIYV